MPSQQLTIRKDGLGGVIWHVYRDHVIVATIWPDGEVTGYQGDKLVQQLTKVVQVTNTLGTMQRFTEEEMLSFLETTVALID